MNNIVGMYVVGIYIVCIWQSHASVIGKYGEKFQMIKCGFILEDSSNDQQFIDDIKSGKSIPIIRSGRIVDYYSPRYSDSEVHWQSHNNIDMNDSQSYICIK